MPGLSCKFAYRADSESSAGRRNKLMCLSLTWCTKVTSERGYKANWRNVETRVAKVQRSNLVMKSLLPVRST